MGMERMDVEAARDGLKILREQADHEPRSEGMG